MTAFTTCVNSVLEVFLAVAGGPGFAATVREGTAPDLGRLIPTISRSMGGSLGPNGSSLAVQYHSRRRDTMVVAWLLTSSFRSIAAE